MSEHTVPMGNIAEIDQRAALTGLAVGFYNHGLEQLDNNVIFGEDHAKAAMLVAMVRRSNLILSGLPGGGKSTLAGSMHHLVEGVPEENAVWVPGISDMAPIQLTGGKVIKKESVQIEEEGKDDVEYDETRVTDLAGLVHPNAEFIVLDELTRMQPYTVNAVNPVLENRRLETNAGVVPLPGLVAVVATVNPGEIKQATFKLSDANTSRYTVGAAMGEIEPELRKAMNKKVREFQGKPENITPVISKEGLQAINHYITHHVSMGNMGDLVDDLTVKAADAIKDHGVHETDNRITQQIQENAKALAGLRKPNGVVEQDDVTDATEMVIHARLGAHGTKGSESISSIADTVTKPYTN